MFNSQDKIIIEAVFRQLEPVSFRLLQDAIEFQAKRVNETIDTMETLGIDPDESNVHEANRTLRDLGECLNQAIYVVDTDHSASK